jgi:hypothetical protein
MFEIKITETRQVRKTIGKHWAKVGSDEEERDIAFWQNKDKEPKTRIVDKMGYTPETETVVDETIVRLQQNVDSLDIEEVIRAINNL